MEKCNLHTILRLPTGIFYAAGVKTNVLFFSKPEKVTQDKGNTKNVWVYDLRSNMPAFGKRTTFNESHYKDFYKAVGGYLTQVDEKARKAFVKKHKEDPDGCRLRCFTREEIAAKDDSLDLSWIRDDSTEDAANLPEPDVLINEAIKEMAGAMNELKAILVQLGAADEGSLDNA
jgi:type I restriction enzyme M protein